ncbi:hypothetical protein C5B42_05195 [Candidatus Cerribacteria bacterium 'Amazon FNV 2010 28 9']|uniref:Uncharacterized protein n=1 Tax=Candidatus Cerribacteria bacterium 'Amazon FNV 2010 28 9' TaxID=2081795 RepID=A0A317JNQ1_9BACT|nr:MAG: hypothetical protein C5B42_05195 [Candidatus Cerribacteria bacterium 'Amazon FNV 2010 28 9']
MNTKMIAAICGISCSAFVLAACSAQTTQTSTVTPTDQSQATMAPVAATPQSSPESMATPDSNDPVTKQPALSSADDTTSLKADLSNTNIANENFN